MRLSVVSSRDKTVFASMAPRVDLSGEGTSAFGKHGSCCEADEPGLGRVGTRWGGRCSDSSCWCPRVLIGQSRTDLNVRDCREHHAR